MNEAYEQPVQQVQNVKLKWLLIFHASYV
jgi:hypothetical protein